MPQRLQRKRTAGYRLPEGALYVGRPTRWGNPFAVGERIDDPYSLFRNAHINGVSLYRDGVVEDRAHAVALFDFWTMATVPFTQADVVRELGGKDLACWCPLVDADGNGVPCHADVLLALASGAEVTL